MERHPIPAIVLCCETCGLVRIADDYAAACARASAHRHLSGHIRLEYCVVEAPEQLRLAQAFEQRSTRTILGYVKDGVTDDVERSTGEGVDPSTIEALVAQLIHSH